MSRLYLSDLLQTQILYSDSPVSCQNTYVKDGDIVEGVRFISYTDYGSSLGQKNLEQVVLFRSYTRIQSCHRVFFYYYHHSQDSILLYSNTGLFC